ncbi:MAG: 2Fe-2S iron-sulfur cluster-binding protein [Patescibacteria group bacterium]|jgi:ferredoxin
MPKVTFITDNKTVEAQAGELLREVCQHNGLTLPFGCENGLCGTCLISIKKGAENLTDKTDQEKDTLEVLNAYPEQRLACQCHLKDGDVTFDLD